MKFEQVKASKYIRFFLEDASRPAAILGADGIVYQVNDPFRVDFGMEQIENIKDLPSDTLDNLWDKFLKTAKMKGYTTCKIPLMLPSHEKSYSVKVRLMYCEHLGKIIALFNTPLSYKKEQELRNSKVFRKSDNLMIVIDKKGVIQDVNELTYEFFNLQREFFIGKKIFELEKFFSVLPETTEYVQKVITEGYAEIMYRYEQSPEDIRYYQIKTFFDEDNRMFLTRMADHTDKVVLEQRLAHIESISEVGQLAASIAHEIRNPITALKGFTQLLRNSTAEESMKYLTVIDDEIIRMESILSEMLVLSKPSTEQKKLLMLREILADMINIVYPKARLEGILIVQNKITIPEILIYGNEVKLKQVLLNVMKNALEAMNSGGTLTLGLEVGEDERLNLTVADTGKGMTVPQLNQIFMPFFTTRSEGTGLGLPFVIKTVEDHGGTITVSSEVGVGSKFTLSFPPAAKPIHSNAQSERELYRVAGQVD